MRLQRSRNDSKLFGLCGGIARSMQVDATWIRLGLVVGTFFTGGMLLFVYVIASMVIPKEPVYSSQGPYWYMPPATGYGFNSYGAAAAPAPSASHLDSMVQNLEEQALSREISDLRSKLARYEQQ
jgi:phage shock protein C